METRKTVLIPTDFSEVCDNAIHHGVELAKNLKYQVCLLHVIDSKTKSDLKKENKRNEYIDEKLSVIANKYKDEFGVEISHIAREGDIFSIIPAVAEEINAELMMLGTHGKKGIQHVVGSYAYKVVTSSPCPTIVVQNKTFGGGYKNIVFPIKDIDFVRQKVQWTIKVAKAFDATVQIFVVETKVEAIKFGLEVVTNQIIQVFKKYNVKFTIEKTKESNFNKKLLKYAGKNHSDLILIMSKMYLFDFHIAPSEEMLFFNEAQIPVMCINPVELNQYRFSI